jgi:hypothetical protein
MIDYINIASAELIPNLFRDSFLQDILCMNAKVQAVPATRRVTLVNFLSSLILPNSNYLKI